MTATLADPSLWYGLALKIAMTASIVVAASVVVERSGPFIGSLIAALPTAGGAAMIILALEHSAQFISQSAVGSLIANAACALFALSYAALAQKHGLRLSLGGAFLVWLCTVFLLRLVDWSATGAVIMNAVIYPLAILAARRYRIPGAAKRVEVTGADLAWRAGVVTLCVIVVTAASNSIGSYFSGVFAFFSGGHGLVLHHSAPAHQRAGGGERRRACADPADRAGLGPFGRASARCATWCVVVICGGPFHRPRLERSALALAQPAGLEPQGMNLSVVMPALVAGLHVFTNWQ
jgi:uncharacterized membrane protein (GlpM family)